MTVDHDLLLVLNENLKSTEAGFLDLRAEVREEVKFIRRLFFTTIASTVFTGLGLGVLMMVLRPPS